MTRLLTEPTPAVLGLAERAAPTAPIDRQPLRHHAYRGILARILSGEYAPGMRLRDATLAEALDVSRTPVREALLRLEREGFLAADMGRGFTVTALRRDEGIEVLTLLRTLECLALDQTESPTPEELDALDALAHRIREATSLTDVFELQAEWHARLLAHCPNTRLRPMLESARAQASRYMLACLRMRAPEVRPASCHLEVTAALRQGDRSGAIVALRRQASACLDAMRGWLDTLDAAA